MTPHQKVAHTLERLRREGVIAEYDPHFYTSSHDKKRGHMRLKYSNDGNEVDIRIYVNSNFEYTNQQKKFGWVNVKVLNSTKADQLHNELKTKIRARVATAVFEKKFYEVCKEYVSNGLLKNVEEASFKEDVYSRFDFKFTFINDKKSLVDVTFNGEKPKIKTVHRLVIDVLHFSSNAGDAAIRRRLNKYIHRYTAL